MAAANTRNAQGSGFTNYNDILNANKTSGQGLGDAVGKGLESQAGTVKTNVNNQTNDFNNGIQSANDKWSNSTGTGVADLAKYYADQAAQGNYAGIASGPTGQTVDPKAAGTSFSGYNYSGPTGLKDVSGLQSQANSAMNVGKQAGSAQGQQNLLKQYVAGNNAYNQGESSFDQALLNKYGQGQINQGRKNLSNIGNTTNTAINNANSQANTTANAIGSEKNDLINKLTGTISGDANGVGGLLGTNGIGQTQAQAYKTDAQNTTAAINALIARGNMTPEQKQLLTPDHLSKLGIDPSQILNNTNSSFTDKTLSSYFVPSSDTGGIRLDANQLGAANNIQAMLGHPAVTNNVSTNAYNPNNDPNYYDTAASREAARNAGNNPVRSPNGQVKPQNITIQDYINALLNPQKPTSSLGNSFPGLPARPVEPTIGGFGSGFDTYDPATVVRNNKGKD